jgi:hypothetical protein
MADEEHLNAAPPPPPPPQGDGEGGGDGEGQEEEEGEGEEDPNALPFNPLGDPNFMAFFLQMLQQEQAAKDAAKRQPRVAVPEVAASALRSRRGELRALAVAALPDLLVRVGPHVWGLVVARLDARDMARLASCCWCVG